MRYFLTLIMLLAWPAAAETTAFDVDDRRYHVRTPAKWDGQTPLPVLLHFHGWGRNGEQVTRNKRVYGAADAHQMLLVAPDARGRSFDFWAPDSADLPFIDALTLDVAERFPILDEQIYVSGFSWGGAMAWRLACARGDRYRTYLPIAGHLYSQENEECDAGPIDIVHVHGLKDTVVDPVPGTAEEPWRAVSLWHEINQCDAAAEQRAEWNTYDCAEWSCDSGKLTRVCLHPRGHAIPKDWLSLILADLLAANGASAN